MPKGWFYSQGPAVPSSQETMCDGLIVLIRAAQHPCRSICISAAPACSQAMCPEAVIDE